MDGLPQAEEVSAELTSDPPAEVLNLPEGPLAYIDEGPREAPALVAIHGIPGSARDFRYLAPQVSSRVRFVRPDLPGFGGSAPTPAAVNGLTGRARVLIALADRLGLARFGVLGHSMGGSTALVMAAEHAARVDRLALVASVALRPHRGLAISPRSLGLIGRGLGLPLLKDLLVPAARERYRKRGFPGADQMDAAAFAVHFRALAAVDFARLRRAVTRPLPPTLVAYARDDHLIETELSEELARSLPGARVLVFGAGGHNLQKTRAVELGRAIADWLGA